jgi:hypothetical protein
MFEQDRLNPDARRERTSDLYPYALQLAGCRILDVLRRKQSNSKISSLGQVGNPRVGELLRACNWRPEEHGYQYE